MHMSRMSIQHTVSPRPPGCVGSGNISPVSPNLQEMKKIMVTLSPKLSEVQLQTLGPMDQSFQGT